MAQHRVINQIGKYSSVSLASVQGVEHHFPTMHTPSGYGYQLRREENIYKYIDDEIIRDYFLITIYQDIR